jgi:hypothetical protein
MVGSNSDKADRSAIDLAIYLLLLVLPAIVACELFGISLPLTRWASYVYLALLLTSPALAVLISVVALVRKRRLGYLLATLAGCFELFLVFVARYAA